MSEGRSRTSHHVEDLSVLSRRGALSAADRRAFADALEASPTLSTAHQLGLDFDQIATVEPGDDALIAAVVGLQVSRERPRGFAQLRGRALLLVAALAITGSAAAWWQRSRTEAHDRERATPPPSVGVAIARPRPAPGVEVTTSAAAPRAASTPTNVKRAVEPRIDAPAAAPIESAEALFREANAARRSGDTAVARALYLRLERQFPASDEAQVAHVSLGNLLLGMGRAREAEQQFASYPGGAPALLQEALVGRAQSLAALGHSSEERRVWESLLRDHPTSIYAARAKQRLAVLE
jgi:TolA-binding protein